MSSLPAIDAHETHGASGVDSSFDCSACARRDATRERRQARARRRQQRELNRSASASPDVDWASPHAATPFPLSTGDSALARASTAATASPLNPDGLLSPGLEAAHFSDSDSAVEADDEEPHARGCTYTSSLPEILDPLSSCARTPEAPNLLGVGASISFSGCGGFYPVLFGMACYLQDHFDLTAVQFLGCSGGCLPALTLAAGLDCRSAFFEKFNALVIRDSSAMPLRGYLSFINTCERHAHAYFDAAIHLRANGRLHLSTTRVRLGAAPLWRALQGVLRGRGLRPLLHNERISQWTSKEDLIDCVAASTWIPILASSGVFKRWRGEAWLDGGLTDLQPVLDAHTIALKPFMHTPASMLRRSTFMYVRTCALANAEMFLQGYEDARAMAATRFAHLTKLPDHKIDRRPVLPPDIAERLRVQREAQEETTQRHAFASEFDATWRAFTI